MHLHALLLYKFLQTMPNYKFLNPCYSRYAMDSDLFEGPKRRAGLHLGIGPNSHVHTKLPHIMDMSVHLDMGLRNRSCQPCTPDHPLGPQCCGMCGFWENLRYKNVERQPWVAPCNIRDVSPNPLFA